MGNGQGGYTDLSQQIVPAKPLTCLNPWDFSGRFHAKVLKNIHIG